MQQPATLLVRRKGVDLAATIWHPAVPDAPSALLVHGLGFTSRYFEQIAARLSPGLRVVAFDQRGANVALEAIIRFPRRFVA